MKNSSGRGGSYPPRLEAEVDKQHIIHLRLRNIGELLNIHPARAWLLSSPSFPSRQVNMANSCWMNFSFIPKTPLQVQDI